MNTESKNQMLFYRCFRIFSKKDKRKIILMLLAQSSIAFLDLVGVLTMGVIGGLLIYQGKSIDPNSRINILLQNLGVSDLNFKNQLAALGITALFLLTTKSLVSVILMRKSLRFFYIVSSRLSTEIIRKVFSLSISKINENSIQKINYISINGANAITLIVSNYATLISDLFLTIILIVGLIYTDLQTTIVIIIIFGTTILLLYQFYKTKSYKYGAVRSETSVRANEIFYEAVQGMREIFVSGRIGNYISAIGEKLSQSAVNESRIAFIPSVNKYALEILIVITVFILSLVQFVNSSDAHAIAVITIFLAASTRIVPALLRIQGTLINIKNSKGLTEETFEFIDGLKDEKVPVYSKVKFRKDWKVFNPYIEINNLIFKYSDSENFTLSIPKMEIKPFETVAIVGKSGSGKSTLIDLLLGLNKPIQGEVKISGLAPIDVINQFPGAIAYVPQAFYISNGTLKENLSMGLNLNEITDEDLTRVIEQAQLQEFVSELPNGINSFVGDRGMKLSGGQRQRLSIARALLTNPSILVLDEATSSLDAETENSLTDFFTSISGQLSLIVVAHRLSTIKRIPRIMYMEDGQIRSIGDFESLREINSDFDKQVELAGY